MYIYICIDVYIYIYVFLLLGDMYYIGIGWETQLVRTGSTTLLGSASQRWKVTAD